MLVLRPRWQVRELLDNPALGTPQGLLRRFVTKRDVDLAYLTKCLFTGPPLLLQFNAIQLAIPTYRYSNSWPHHISTLSPMGGRRDNNHS
jgi:hypothetical protein